MATTSPLGFSHSPNNFDTNNKRLSKNKSIFKNDVRNNPNDYTPNPYLFFTNKPQTPSSKDPTQFPYQQASENKNLNFNSFSSSKTFFNNISVQTIF